MWNKQYYPSLSVIIPSYNQGEFLEETLLSIISQNYPKLELIVIDGGSTDSSVEIIEKYQNFIYYWISEQDEGQSHAINKGLKKATGEWVAWINSDDCYLENAFHYVFSNLPFERFDFLYGQCYTGESINKAVEKRHPPDAKKELKDILRFFYNVSHIIPSQSVFIKKTLIDKVGFLNERLHYCMDLEWYCRIYLATNKRYFYDKTICFYRINPFTKTGSINNKGPEEAMQIAEYYAEYLDKSEKRKLVKLVSFSRALRVHMQSPKPSFKTLLSIAARFPFIAFQNISFRIQLKKVLNFQSN